MGSITMDPRVARTMWKAIEPYHAVVYFAAETTSAYGAIGLKGYWMGYFASRSAAFGEASADLVLATFYNFHPRLVQRAIPDAWRFSSPDAVLAARYEVAAAATRRFPGSDAQIAEALVLAEAAARAATPQGRALFAAHAALPWPHDPRLRLWHATTLLREHRGDGHIALLVGYGIDGLEAHIVAAADGRVDPAWQKQARGFSDEEWSAGEERLRARGLIDEGSHLTETVPYPNPIGLHR